MTPSDESGRASGGCLAEKNDDRRGQVVLARRLLVVWTGLLAVVILLLLFQPPDGIGARVTALAVPIGGLGVAAGLFVQPGSKSYRVWMATSFWSSLIAIAAILARISGALQ